MCRTPIRRTTSRRTSPSVSWSRCRDPRAARWRGSSPCRNARSRTCRPGSMHAHLKAFLKFLALNRNASAHTVRAYESDVSQFLEHAAAAAGLKSGALDLSALDRTVLRAFLAELHRQGQSRATAARKLAAIRTFLRYLRREGAIDDDPGALVA